VSDSPTADARADDAGPADDQAGGPAFAHASEAELSRILDFYAVRWEYEPRVFPILWNTDGDVLESFAPDFYLPDVDLYVELTTLRQKLVRKKNRKLRRLRELYPDVRIKLFYARDFRALMLKYGRLALADELTGTSGQVTPERPYAELLAGPFGVDPAAEGAPVGVAGSGGVSLDATDPPVVPSHRRRRRRPDPTRRPIEAEAS
jgi:hypothetical protein